MKICSTPQFIQLQKKLSKLGFDQWALISSAEIETGSLWMFSVIGRFIFQAFPELTAEFLHKHSWFVLEEDDRLFCEQFLKILKAEFEYKPSITPHQLVSASPFAVQKVLILSECISLFERRMKVTQKRVKKCQQGPNGTEKEEQNNTKLPRYLELYMDAQHRKERRSAPSPHYACMEEEGGEDALQRALRLLEHRRSKLNALVREPRRVPAQYSTHAALCIAAPLTQQIQSASEDFGVPIRTDTTRQEGSEVWRKQQIVVESKQTNTKMEASSGALFLRDPLH